MEQEFAELFERLGFLTTLFYENQKMVLKSLGTTVPPEQYRNYEDLKNRVRKLKREGNVLLETIKHISDKIDECYDVSDIKYEDVCERFEFYKNEKMVIDEKRLNRKNIKEIMCVKRKQ